AQDKPAPRSRGCATIADPAQKEACQKQLERKAERAAARKAEADRIAQACAGAADKAGCANDERAKMRAAKKAKAKAKGKEKEKDKWRRAGSPRPAASRAAARRRAGSGAGHAAADRLRPLHRRRQAGAMRPPGVAKATERGAQAAGPAAQRRAALRQGDGRE